jgi:hypothetical protein
MQTSIFGSPDDGRLVSGPACGILVMGPNASGKTTAVQMAFDGVVADMRVVHADTELNAGSLVLIQERLTHIWRSGYRTVVVESTNRAALCLLRLLESQRGETTMHVCVTTMAAEDMAAAIQKRCAKAGKAFRGDYWDQGRCRYEGEGRYRGLGERFALLGASVTYWRISDGYHGQAGLVEHLRALAREA